METIIEKKTTELNNDYWGSGAYQKEYDKLWNDLVPPQADADTIHGELIRSCGRLLHEYMNNGNCNAVDIEEETCDECLGSGMQDTDEDEEERECSWCDNGYTQGEKVIDEYYEMMLNFIEEHCEDNCCEVDDLRNFMTDPSVGYTEYKFDKVEKANYNNLIDMVVYYCLTKKNKRNPNFKGI